MFTQGNLAPKMNPLVAFIALVCYVQLCDLLSYKQASDTARLEALDELVEQSQRLPLGY